MYSASSHGDSNIPIWDFRVRSFATSVCVISFCCFVITTRRDDNKRTEFINTDFSPNYFPFIRSWAAQSFHGWKGEKREKKSNFSAGASKKMLSFYVIWGDITCFGSEMKYTIMGSNETHRSRLESLRQSLDSGFFFASVSFEWFLSFLLQHT